MTKAPLGVPISEKENKVMPITRQVVTSQGASKQISPYKPKAPSPPKSSSIGSYFSPKRSKSLQDITSISRKRDAQKSNTPEPVRTVSSFFKPQSTPKRPFTAVEADESIAVKRARRYLGSSQEDEVAASPFFASKGRQNTEKAVKGTDCSASMGEIAATGIEMEHSGAEEMSKGEATILETSQDTEQERQVSESPPRAWTTTDPTPTDEDEVILDSPTANRSTHLRPSQITETASTDRSPHEIAASPGYESPEADTFPPSPPPSRPLIMALPTLTSQKITQITTRDTTTTQTITDTPTFISILTTGTKKAYTPRPSHCIFPDTPTPSPGTLNPQHSLMVQGWKEKFSHSSATPKLFGTISSKPMTPVHTPVLRRAVKTPGMGNMISKACVVTTFGKTTTTTSKVMQQVVESDEMNEMAKVSAGVEQIEEVSPPRGRTSLERFRFMGR